MSVASVYVGRRNDGLIAEVARLWIKPTDEVLDLTYGRGRFWTRYRPELFVTSDLYEPADMTLDYLRLPAWLDRWCDVIVFDPPYITTGTKTKTTVPDMYARYGLGNGGAPDKLADLRRLLTVGIAGCARGLRPGGRLLVKCCDFVESGRRHWMRQHVVTAAQAAGLTQVDEFVHYSGTGPQPGLNLDGTPRRQIHSRRAHSFLCVFKKGKR